MLHCPSEAPLSAGPALSGRFARMPAQGAQNRRAFLDWPRFAQSQRLKRSCSRSQLSLAASAGSLSDKPRPNFRRRLGFLLSETTGTLCPPCYGDKQKKRRSEMIKGTLGMAVEFRQGSFCLSCEVGFRAPLN